VGKFVEYYGVGLSNITLADRATIANMGPEYGATTGIFSVDAEALRYLETTNRGDLVPLVEAYYREQGMFREDGDPDPLYDEHLALDLGDVVPSLSGPRRPQDRVTLPEVGNRFMQEYPEGKSSDEGRHYPTKDITIDGETAAAIYSVSEMMRGESLAPSPAFCGLAALLAATSAPLALVLKARMTPAFVDGTQALCEAIDRARH
jgi:aconitate hydratase